MYVRVYLWVYMWLYHPSPALFWALISKQTLDGERFEIRDSGLGTREIPSDKRQTVV